MSRKVERRIEIAASPETVWKALTEPGELTKWFCLDARVEPGKGGSVWYSWGPRWEGASRIEIWEPNRRLRTVSYPPAGNETTWLGQVAQPGSPDAIPIALELELEGTGGKTVLRLVHSGFGDGSEWDDEYDGVRRGWAFELGSLRHYLEKHQGSARSIVWVRHPVGLPMQDAWRRIMGEGGIARGRMPVVQGEGARCAFQMRTGESIEGVVLLHEPPKQLAMTVDNMGDGLMRVELEGPKNAVEANLWLAVYDRPASELKPIESRWSGMLRQLFPPPREE